MTINHVVAVRNALADLIDTTINTGAGTATLVFETAGSAEVATVNLQNPAFGAASGGTITLQGVPLSDSNATGGTVAQFKVNDRDGDEVFSGSVGTSGEDINLSSLAIGAGDTVEIVSLTYSAPV